MQRTRAVSKTLGSLKQHILNLLSRRFDVWFKLIQNDEFKKKCYGIFLFLFRYKHVCFNV